MRQSRIALAPAPIIVLLLVLAAASNTLAATGDHLDGLFLRLSAGFGGTSTSLEDGVDKLELSGGAGDLNIAIGGIVAPNLALHGTLFGWSATDPTVELNGTEIGDINGDLTAAGLGIGLTYYFMPANLYVSGTIGSGRLTIEVPGVDGETERGLLLDLTLGKEWWVGERWGLGVAGGMQYHSFEDPDVLENWSGTSFTLRFSATMN